MARLVKLGLGLGIALFLVSCATATIETNKNSAYSDQITKLYVVVDVGDWKCYAFASSSSKVAPKLVFLGDYIVDNLLKDLQGDGIETKAVRVTELELGGDQLNKGITDFGANRVLLVQLSHGLTADNVQLSQGVLDVSVLDSSDKSAEKYPMVWRGKVTTVQGFDPDKVIESIMSGLQKDGLIPTPVAPAK